MADGQGKTNMVEGQIQLYEMIARGKPFKEVLASLVLFIESHTPEMICTILLLDEDGQHMWTGAAPSFPSGLSAAIDGSSIGPSAGSCGTAAYRGENVFVEDIQTDPLWEDYRNYFLLHGLRACWSSPFFDQQHKVLGTFAMYFRQPALPREHDLELINIATRIASACMIRKRMDSDLRQSQRHLSMIHENISEGLFLIEILPDFRFRFSSVNPAFLSLYQLNLRQVLGNDVEKVLPPSTHQLVLSKYKEAIQENSSVQWEQELIHPEGKKKIVATINPVIDDQGVCSHLAGNVHESGSAQS
jgi:GAF domain-containing protein